MKKTILLITFNLFTALIMAQDYSSLPATQFNGDGDFKEAEEQVLECAEYLLVHPRTENEPNRLSAFRYLFLWMQGTADHTFSIGQREMDLTKGKTPYLTIYLAAAVKTVLESPEKLTDDQVYQAASALLAAYCSKPGNHLKPNRAIKKIVRDK